MAGQPLRKDKEFFHLLFVNAGDAIIVTETNGTIIAANAMASRFFGYTQTELSEFKKEELIEPVLVTDKKKRKVEAALVETSGYTKKHKKVPVEVSRSNFKFDSVCYQIYTIRDISKRKAVEEEMYRLANIDPLTDLPNRRYMQKRIEEEKYRAERSGKVFSFIMSDIDGFKQFNDNYGHDCGDYVLVEIAAILTESIRKQDIVSRWGGEEFLFLLPETNEEGALKTAEKIRSSIESKNFIYRGLSLRITMTFGVSICSWEDDIEDRIKKADTALLLGKNKGKNCVVLQ